MISFTTFFRLIGKVLIRGSVLLVLGFSSLTVVAGPLDVSNAFKIQGDYLSSATDVQVNGKSVEFQIVNDHEIAIVLPAVSDQSMQISVVTPAGTIGFDYAVPQSQKKASPPLSLREVNPSSGTSLGGTVAVIRGASFKGHKDWIVSFGGTPATNWHVNGDEVMTVTVPPHAPGLVDIQVKSGDSSEAFLKQAFTYVAPPQINSVSPISGPVTGGTKITIGGAHFGSKGVRVMLGRAEAIEVSVKDTGVLEVVAPAYTEGATDVTVINPDGQQGQSKEAFLYLPVPTIRAVTPAH